MDVVVGCGKGKRAHPAPVADLYTGTFIRAAVRWARSMDGARLLILSAKHGLIPATTVVAPYSASFSSKGYAKDPTVEAPVDTEVTAAQVADLDLGPEVVLLAGRDYLEHLTTAAPHLTITRPFYDEAVRRFHDGRTGYQAQLLAEWLGDLPRRTTR